jgi:hypothetical protein
MKRSLYTLTFHPYVLLGLLCIFADPCPFVLMT